MIYRKQKALTRQSELNKKLSYSNFITINSTPKRGWWQRIQSKLTHFASHSKRHTISQIGLTRSLTMMQPPRGKLNQTSAMNSDALDFMERG